IQLFDQAGSAMHRVNFRIGMVFGSIKKRQFDSARGWIAEMREIAGDGITSWQRCSLLMWEAIIAREECIHETMRQRLGDALAIAQREAVGFIFFNWCRPWMPRLCEEALTGNIEVAYVRELIQRYHVVPPSPSTQHWPWRIRILTLGTFELFHEDKSVQF